MVLWDGSSPGRWWKRRKVQARPTTSWFSRGWWKVHVAQQWSPLWGLALQHSMVSPSPPQAQLPSKKSGPFFVCCCCFFWCQRFFFFFFFMLSTCGPALQKPEKQPINESAYCSNSKKNKKQKEKQRQMLGQVNKYNLTFKWESTSILVIYRILWLSVAKTERCPLDGSVTM